MYTYCLSSTGTELYNKPHSNMEAIMYVDLLDIKHVSNCLE